MLPLFIGIAYIVIALGLLRLRPWARRVSWGISLVSVIFGITALLEGIVQYIPNIIFSMIILFYLSRPSVKDAFIDNFHKSYRPPPT
jgi:hypothetical protein